MRFPWQKQTNNAPAAPRQRLGPSLLSVKVEPLQFNGETIAHKLVMNFDTGEIVLGKSPDAAKLETLAADIRAELGMNK